LRCEESMDFASGWTGEIWIPPNLGFGSFCCVFWHCRDHARALYADIVYLALFLVLTSFLAIGSFDRTGRLRDNQSFWISRAKRIALPLLFWCVIYRGIYETVSDQPFSYLKDPMTLLIGSYVHLWFLPFVILTLPLIPIISLSISFNPPWPAACTYLIGRPVR
jgi:UDP-N-acetylmuramyl pentapeptide phosphotransferase/UDP-N-acetylglucosamine-1-phosphate transferase